MQSRWNTLSSNYHWELNSQLMESFIVHNPEWTLTHTASPASSQQPDHLREFWTDLLLLLREHRRHSTAPSTNVSWLKSSFDRARGSVPLKKAKDSQWDHSWVTKEGEYSSSSKASCMDTELRSSSHSLEVDIKRHSRKWASPESLSMFN